MGAGTRGWAWLLGGALLLSGCAGRTDSTQGSGGKTVEEMLAARRGEQICRGGVWYERKEDARAYLLMGIDREGQAVSSGSYNGGGQADLLLVLVLDREERTYRVLPIDRDTMTPVDELGLFGDTVRTRVQQIALAHFYGDGLEASCENTVAAVSNLLGVFAAYTVRRDFPLSALPVVGRRFSKGGRTDSETNNNQQQQ